MKFVKLYINRELEEDGARYCRIDMIDEIIDLNGYLAITLQEQNDSYYSPNSLETFLANIGAEIIKP